MSTTEDKAPYNERIEHFSDDRKIAAVTLGTREGKYNFADPDQVSTHHWMRISFEERGDEDQYVYFQFNHEDEVAFEDDDPFEFVDACLAAAEKYIYCGGIFKMRGIRKWMDSREQDVLEAWHFTKIRSLSKAADRANLALQQAIDAAGDEGFDATEAMGSGESA